MPTHCNAYTYTLRRHVGPPVAFNPIRRRRRWWRPRQVFSPKTAAAAATNLHLPFAPRHDLTYKLFDIFILFLSPVVFFSVHIIIIIRTEIVLTTRHVIILNTSRHNIYIYVYNGAHSRISNVYKYNITQVTRARIMRAYTCASSCVQRCQ